ncbi:hypothetical protein AB0958_18830 [Streptomyces sp. NPDC006655]|uniref:hypothetical protein n=1 Tax=Streptomyces sp. NPDC006655 TaxID=3156898 RepID=UPI003454182A
MGQGTPFVPQFHRDSRSGPRDSDVALLLDLVDTSEPAFRHIARALKEMRDAGVTLDEAAVSIAVKIGRSRHNQTGWERRHTAPGHQGIVYYIRRSDLIKIGTTADPFERFASLMPDEILAFEPGGPDEEAARHAQFASCRVNARREYFRPASRLMKHIDEVREQHGDPDPYWPTTANLHVRGYIRRRSAERRLAALPEPGGELVIAIEGARRLGIDPSTVTRWVERGRLAPAGRNASNRRVFYLDQMRYLAELGQEWKDARSGCVYGPSEVRSCQA